MTATAPLRPLRRLAAAALSLAILATLPPAAVRAQAVDHYVLALSWSPTYCETRDPRKEPLQCGLDADRTFIVHGLWPNTANSAPANCRTTRRGPSRRDVRETLAVMPSEGLIHYQWRKHGTCSGLDADDYFAAVRKAAAAVAIPPGLATIKETIRVKPEVLRAAFLAANPEMRKDGIYVACRGDDLVDVRICLTPSLEFRDCPNVARQRCRSKMLEVDPPR